MASFCSISPPQPRHRLFVSGVGIELRRVLGSEFEAIKYPRQLVLTACSSDSVANTFNFEKPILKFRQAVASLPPLLLIKRQSGANLLLGLSVMTACLMVAMRIYVTRSVRDKRPGTVADLVRRGQLRSDRRGISKPVKYEDPFNNPLVKVSKGNSTVEICGKVYRTAPVTLTEEQRAVHQKRRSRAYQWKRPKVFLKEGDPIPPDVDPETVRWIPSNHPFATTVNDIDEELAQTNIYQKHGVPFRIKAEHDALQKKLEALQNDQKLNKLVIDPVNAKDFERAFKSQSKLHEQAEGSKSGYNGKVSDSKPDESPENSDKDAEI